MPLYPKQSLVPPGGYHYSETSPGGVRIDLTSDSVENLAAALLKFRTNNGIPIGNPLQDVVDAICKPYPHFCNDTTPGDVIRAAPSSFAHISQRASEWMARLWRIGAQLTVPAEIAERRATICSTCPRNVDYRAGGCGSCIDSLDRLAFVWLRGRSTSLDKQLGACSGTGQLNRVAVQASVFPPETPENLSSLPAPCWHRPQP